MGDGTGSRQRLYALDNLRASMMWLGIVLHVGVIHMVGEEWLPWRDNQTTPAADLLIAFIHAFRMPVFFILAGFFVAMLFEQRGLAFTVRHRLRRLALPFVIFWPPLFLLCAVFALLFVYRMAHGTWGMDPGLMPGGPAPVAQSFNTLHLWFLWQLLWLSLITPPLQGLMQRSFPQVGSWLARCLATMGKTPWGIALLSAVLAGIGAQYGSGLVRPDNSFVPAWMEWAHNGLFYVFGLALYTHRQELLAHYTRRWKWYGAMGLLLFLASGIILEQVPAQLSNALPMDMRLAFSFAYNAAGWCWSFALVGAFTAYLGRPNRACTYLADSSYWVYLVHMPMTIGLGALMYGLPWPAGVKMLVNISVTTALCLLSYHWMVRYTAIGVLLNGKRHAQKKREHVGLPTS